MIPRILAAFGRRGWRIRVGIAADERHTALTAPARTIAPDGSPVEEPTIRGALASCWRELR